MDWLYYAIRRLAEHTPGPGDYRPLNPPRKHNAGYLRRLHVLSELSGKPTHRDSQWRSPVGLFYAVGRELRNILLDPSPHHLLTTRDPALDALSPESLAEAAFQIDRDVKRALALCRNPETALLFNYEGPLEPRAAARKQAGA